MQNRVSERPRPLPLPPGSLGDSTPALTTSSLCIARIASNASPHQRHTTAGRIFRAKHKGLMHKFLSLATKVVSGLALTLAVNAAALAAEGDTHGAAVPSPAIESGPASSDQATMIPANGSPIILEAGKGTLIRLPRAAGTLFIGNPEVADLQPKSPTMVYLTAKAPGETVLYAVDAEERVMLNAPVRVQHNLPRMRQRLSAVAPGDNVSIASVDNSLVLSGNVS